MPSKACRAARRASCSRRSRSASCSGARTSAGSSSCPGTGGSRARPSSASVRPLARYAAPMSWMKTVGEWVSRPSPGGRSRAARSRRRTPSRSGSRPSARRTSARAARGRPARRASSPSALNCGSQNRLRFGSLPMMKFWQVGDVAGEVRRRGPAKLAWSSSVSGVVRLPKLLTDDEHLDAVELRRRGRGCSAGSTSSARRVGFAGVPDRGDPHGVEAGELEQVDLRLRLGERVRLAPRPRPRRRSSSGRRPCAAGRGRSAVAARRRSEQTPHRRHGSLSAVESDTDRTAAEDASGEAGRLPLPRRRRPRPLHRQGEVAAPARALVLPADAATRAPRSGSCRAGSPTSR